jgi:hypothetical protein
MRLTALGAALCATACANLGAPPGGPPDMAPPLIVSINPDSGAIVPGLKDDLVIRFDEVIEEAPGSGGGFATGRAGGGGSLASRVLLSPVAGRVNVSWHRSSIHVKPREGWRSAGVSASTPGDQRSATEPHRERHADLLTGPLTGSLTGTAVCGQSSGPSPTA